MLEEEIENENIKNIETILKQLKESNNNSNSNSNSNSDSNISINNLKYYLNLSLSKYNLNIIKLILNYSNFSSLYLLNLFKEYSEEGLEPEIINILQEYLSSSDRSYYIRNYIKLRLNGFNNLYVVDPLEENQIEQLYQNIQK